MDLQTKNIVIGLKYLCKINSHFIPAIVEITINCKIWIGFVFINWLLPKISGKKEDLFLRQFKELFKQKVGF